MRYLLDTHIFVWYAKEQESLSRDVTAILDDEDSELLMSMESVKELLMLFRTKRLFRRYWRSSLEMIDSIENEYYVRIVQPDMEVMRTMAKLEINTAEEHNDPSDHVIIAQAITMGLPLISSDHKFPFYEKQGLDLVFNKVKSRKQG